MSDTRPEPHVVEWAFRRHYGGLHRFFLRRTGGDRERSHDLTQQVFADAAAGLSLRQTDTRVVAWLYTVARRRFHDEARRSYRTVATVPLTDAEPARPRRPRRPAG